jgi:2,3-bisphosphoglycerate-independent phosphoglycerate mutase
MADKTLRKLKGYKDFPGPLVTVIMDGVGLGKQDESDGVFLANKPELDRLFQEPIFAKLKAHGKAVGLPSDEDMGNSEVGHNALGCGRVFAQGAQLVNDAFASGKIFQGQAWEQVRTRTKSGGTVHFIGLLSDGNVHSHIDHLYGFLKRCSEEGFQRVRVHPLLDGRDVGEKSALDYLEPLEKKLAELSTAGRDYRVASGGGRMITTMDRYGADWSVVERGWKAHTLGEGRQFKSASEAVTSIWRASWSRPTASPWAPYKTETRWCSSISAGTGP